MIAFALYYSSVYSFDQEAFTGNIGSDPVTKVISFLYFSFITFTTIGYGDISAVSNISRVLVMVEVIYAFTTVTLLISSFSTIKNSLHCNNDI